MLKLPLDATPYAQDGRSRPADADLRDGLYVYVQDEFGVVWVLPDGPHLHPKVLGGGRAAMQAGDLRIENGRIKDLTNLSGTFQFEERAGLLAVADELRKQGLEIEAGAVRFFTWDGSRPPEVLS